MEGSVKWGSIGGLYPILCNSFINDLDAGTESLLIIFADDKTRRGHKQFEA